MTPAETHAALLAAIDKAHDWASFAPRLQQESARDRARAERHSPPKGGAPSTYCRCGAVNPCLDYFDLLADYGIEVDRRVPST